MPEENFGLVIPLVVILLVLWLIYRIKNRIKLIIRDEIYKNFPAIKDTIDNFARRIEYLNAQLEIIERKVKEFEDKTK